DVSGVQPVMRDRRLRVVLARKAMHERGRTERRLAGQPRIDKHRAALAQRAAVAGGEFHEEIVRVLAIDERRAVCGLSGLEQQRIAALAISGSADTMPRKPSVPSPAGRCAITISMLVLKVFVSPRGPPWRS